MKLNLNNLDKSDWPTFRFDQIAQSISERVDPNNTDIPLYYGLEHLDAESVHIRRSGTPDDVKGQKLKCYPGDIIFGKRRAYQRKAAIVTEVCICSAHAMVLRANPEVIDPQLFPFFLHSDQFMHRAIDISVGSLSPTINWKTLREQEFLLPPKEQQAEIAELLWAMDEVVEKDRNVKKTFETYCKTRSLELLGLRGEVEDDGWEKKKIVDVAPLQRGFDLTNGNLVQGKFPVCYSNGVRNYHAESMVKGPGVCTGRSGTIGNVFYIEGDYWPHNTTLWVNDFKNNDPKFIYYLYSHLDFSKKMAGTGVPTLNRNDVHKIVVLIPDRDLQVEIRAEIEQLDLKLNTVNSCCESSKSLQKSLINQVF